jgi:hypothetical protein
LGVAADAVANVNPLRGETKKVTSPHPQPHDKIMAPPPATTQVADAHVINLISFTFENVN